MSTVSKNIQLIIDERYGGNRAEFCRKLAAHMRRDKIDGTVVKQWIERNAISANYLKAVSELCFVDELWITNDIGKGLDGDQEELLSIPIYDPHRENEEYTCTSTDGLTAIPMAFPEGVNKESVKSYRIKNNSMSPSLISGDLAFFDFDDKSGDGMCLLEFKGDTMVRLVQPVGDKYVISAKHSDYLSFEVEKDDGTLEILGRFVGFYRSGA